MKSPIHKFCLLNRYQPDGNRIVEFEVDGHFIGSADTTTHGLMGVELATQLFRDICEQIDGELIEDEEDCSNED